MRSAKPLSLLIVLAGLLLLPEVSSTAPVGAPDSDHEVVQRLDGPEGFTVKLFSGDASGARFIEVDDQGRVWLSQSEEGVVSVFEDTDGDGRADSKQTVLSGLQRPYGLAFYDGWFYVATEGAITRYRIHPTRLEVRRKETIVDDIPTGGHWTRTISFSPGGKLYLSVGSSCNVCLEENKYRAAIHRMDPDGSDFETFATGLRNSVGMRFHPETGELWASENGRDWMGDRYPKEELNRIEQGGFYGWPYFHGVESEDPEFQDQQKVEESIRPEGIMPAHNAPLGMAFYTGDAFPEQYHNDLFIASHGSWNRSVKDGYQVFRFDFEDGELTHEMGKDFLTGWLADNNRDVYGRPVSLANWNGGLLISDDGAGALYFVEWTGGSD